MTETTGLILAGPVLRFRGADKGQWSTAALLVTEGGEAAPVFSLMVPGEGKVEVEPELLRAFEGKKVWRWKWSVPQTEESQEVAYSIGEASYHYVVPAADDKLRIAYGSCFGFHAPETMKKKDKEAMWKVLQQKHQNNPYHIMLMGGDQVYADGLWDKVEVMADWLDQPLEERLKAPFSEEMRKELEGFYFNLYTRLWGPRYYAGKMMGQIPTLMMWDDHDIFDGWGSYPKEYQESPVYQGIYKIARDHFRLFQLQARDDQDLGDGTLLGEKGFTYAYRIGDVAIAALDMRSERTQDQVMSLETLNHLRDWMDEQLSENTPGDGTACKHLLLLSSIPLVYVNMNLLEDMFGALPGHQELEDDFKDQWLSRAHQEERLMLIHRLLNFSGSSGCRVTIVSGDVHTACLGYIQSERSQGKNDHTNVINQLVSSAMVNTPPPGMLVYMLEKVLGGKTEEIDRDITARMLKFPGTSRRFIGARNWLSLTLDEQDRIWSEWYVEGEEKPYTKVIHPITPAK